MKVYTIDEINNYGLNYQELKDHLKLEFFNRVFIRTGDFPKRFRDQAIQACKEYRQASLKSFLVETQFLLTLWTEEKIEIEPEAIQTNEPETLEDSGEQNELPQCSLKTYRGIPYQTQGVISDPTLSPIEPKRRTYRGQTY